jgi:hypothetical protein
LRQKIEAIDEPVSQKYPNYQNDPNAMKRAKEQKSKRAKERIYHTTVQPNINIMFPFIIGVRRVVSIIIGVLNP